MKRLISFQLAGTLATICFAFFVLFHLAVIAGILLFDYAPVEYLWGGRMTTSEELLQFEVLSLLIMAVCLVTVMIRTERVRVGIPGKVVTVLLWVFATLFILNTVGNLLAASLFEKFFSILTALFAVLCLRLALGD